MRSSNAILEVKGLTVAYGTPDRPIKAVADADLAVHEGEIVGVVGESGSGKTTLCSAMLRALLATARVSGSVVFEGRSLLELPEREMRKLRGRALSMILQNPMTSLDPLFTIGSQIEELVHVHDPSLVGGKLGRRAVDLLRTVHITAPESRVNQYPHQLSGGMKQRILTAMATSSAPHLLIADEPTTALDVTIQEEILVLFHEIRQKGGTAIVIVTHDLAVIRRICDRVVVMYAGRIVEDGPVEDVFGAPRHPYTQGLLDSLPKIVGEDVVLSTIPGQVPALADLGPGCAFADRCAHAIAACRVTPQTAIVVGEDHRAFCSRIGHGV